MKCTARDIIDLSNALTKHGGINLLPKVVLRFSRLQRAVRAEAETISEAQQKITDEHLLRGDDGLPVKVTLPDGREDFRLKDPKAYAAAIKDLLSAPVEIAGEPFETEDLIRGEIHSDVVAALHWVFAPEKPATPAP